MLDSFRVGIPYTSSSFTGFKKKKQERHLNEENVQLNKISYYWENSIPSFPNNNKRFYKPLNNVGLTIALLA